MSQDFSWIEFYQAFAKKLCDYATDRTTLIAKIESVYHEIHIKLPKLESDGVAVDIDPFTVKKIK